MIQNKKLLPEDLQKIESLEKGLRLSHDDVTKCYGNVYPITTLGKLLSGVIAILGIGIVALPTGIISSGFMAEMKSRKEKRICPHCGKIIEDE